MIFPQRDTWRQLRNRCSPEGYTIVEVMAAVLILSLLASGIFAVIAAGGRAAHRSTLVQTASYLALDELERLKTHAAGAAGINDTVYNREAAGRGFRIERTVSAEDVGAVWKMTTTARVFIIRVIPHDRDSAIIAIKVAL